MNRVHQAKCLIKCLASVIGESDTIIGGEKEEIFTVDNLEFKVNFKWEVNQAGEKK